MTTPSQIPQAIKLLNSGRLIEAIQLCETCLEKDPLQEELWIILSFAYQKNIQFSSLNKCLEKAVKYFPNNRKLMFRQIECWAYSGDISLGMQHLYEVSEISQSVHSLACCADMAIKYSNYSLAENCLKQALELANEDVALKLNLALIYSFKGKSELALRLITQVMNVQPENYEGCYARSRLKKQTRENNHIDQLKDLLKRQTKNSSAITSLGYALAKESEDIGEFQQSYFYLEMAASKRRASMSYKVEHDTNALKCIREEFSRKMYNDLRVKNQSSSQREPIFIVGLPRSGTTLVERILTSNAHIGSVGEVNSFAFAIMQLVGPHESKLDLIKRSLTIDFEVLATIYGNAIDGYECDGQKVIDKLPLNYLYLGLIKLAYPKAKIIFVKRHPLDSCYAMYKTLFDSGYPFSYDLDDLASYYVAFDQLMKHWKELFGDELFELDYESLVDEQERESRRLAKYCEVEWQNSMLDFHTNSSPTSTASLAQVRQPIYKSSVHSSRQYLVQLSRLVTKLEAAGIECSYQ